MKHKLPLDFLKEKPSLIVIGAGGNGAQFLNGLARMHLSLMALGHPGFRVTVHDGDTVSESNIGRQLFSASDIGAAKSSVLVNRINSYYGLNWTAFPAKWPNGFRYDHYHSHTSIAIGCVDNNSARREIADHLKRGQLRYWLDMGNDSTTGQVVLGESRKFASKRLKTDPTPRLPGVNELYPEINNYRIKENNAPSCSLAGALERQDLFINQILATAALNLLWSFFRQGGLSHHGAFVNSQTGQVTPLPIDPDVWHRMGYADKVPLVKIRKVLRKPGPFRPGLYKLACGHTHEGHGRYRVRCYKCKP